VGNFYTNIVLRGVSEDAVADVLVRLGRKALVVSYERGLVFVYDEEADTQVEGVVESLALTLATELTCPAMASLNQDDDVLLLWLYDAKGTEWRSAWGVKSEGDERPLSLRQFAKQAKAMFDLTAAEDDVDSASGGLLGVAFGIVTRRIFAVAQHDSVLRYVGIPVEPATLGHRYVSQGDLTARDSSRRVRRVQ